MTIAIRLSESPSRRSIVHHGKSMTRAEVCDAIKRLQKVGEWFIVPDSSHPRNRGNKSRVAANAIKDTGTANSVEYYISDAGVVVRRYA